MKDIDKHLSPFVESQFPEFYREEGSRFVDFVKQYYVWMEQENQAINASRSLFDNRDIDKTKDEFVKYFKEKYLNGVPLSTQANTHNLIKHATDIYKSKGTERGVKLVIQGLFDQESTIYFPGKDLLKSSDGTWVKPIYLELSSSSRTISFVGREVVGSASGARAFIENVVKRRIGGRYIDVAYLSNVRGDFITGDYVTTTTDTNTELAPRVVGSMTDLTVVYGGANFAIGDKFDVVSSNGKQGKAIVTGISDKTGTVSFTFVDALTSGGWGYSLDHANVIVSQKVLTLNNITNANGQVTSFQRFEDVTQALANIEYNTATPNNANFVAGAVVENYYSNGDVCGNGTIVASVPTTNNSGYIVIAPNYGNVVAFDTTFAVTPNGTPSVLTQFPATFNANSGVANTTDVITVTRSGGDHGFVNNDIVLYQVFTGNTAISGLTVGVAYFVVNAHPQTLQLSTVANGTPINVTAGLNESGHAFNKVYGSAVATNYADRTAVGNVVGSNTTSSNGYLGVTDITNPFLPTPYANLVGSMSNTIATVANVSTGTGATFAIGLLTDTENVFLSPDFVHSNNSANVRFIANTTTSINLNGNNSGASLQYGSPQTLSTSDNAYGGFGFLKYPGSNMDSILLDCLRFDATTIGSIATVVGLNPGSDYNVDPFVTVVDPYTYGYDKHDYLMNISNVTGAFVEKEQIQQTYNSPAIQLTVTGFSGTAANGTPTTTVITGEFVYQSNSSANVAASGYVLEAGITGGGGTIKLRDVTGTFVNTSNTTTVIKTLSSGGTANATNVAVTTFATTARAIVRPGSTQTSLSLKRINLENTFQVGSTIIGRTSGATATIDSIDQNFATAAIGINANITANVQTSNNVVTSLSVLDSGFGYVDQETVTLTKEGSQYVISAIAALGKQGVGEGFYTSTKGFLDSDKKLHDNDYYQEFSYEVQTKVPFDQYIDVLKQVIHVAGTKPFGKVNSISTVNTSMTVLNSISTS